MTRLYDVIVVGSGAAGVSACFPLVEAGLDVLMLDAGDASARTEPPPGKFLDIRQSQPSQEDWFLSPDQQAINRSPKFRIPGLQYVFDGFERQNRISSDGFSAIGSLASGGLSNTWGAGVAAYEDQDLKDWPISHADLQESYQTIIARMGVCGSREHFPPGLRHALQAPLPLDGNHRYLLERFSKKDSHGFDLWSAHNAVLTQAMEERLPCDASGMCLWGCRRQSIWNAGMDLPRLRRHGNFHHLPGVFVEALGQEGAQWLCLASPIPSAEAMTLRAKKIILAAGTIGSTRIVLSTLRAYRTAVSFRSNPSLAFMLWLPRRFGTAFENAFGMAQLNFGIDRPAVQAYGNLFSAAFLPFGEYIAASGLTYRYGAAVLSCVLSSCVVGNAFLQGACTRHSLSLDESGALHIKGEYAADTAATMGKVKTALRKSFGRLGAILVPGSFKPGAAGTDAHYACTLPMKKDPAPLQTHSDGRLAGCEGLYVADGSVLTHLPSKPLTLTLMANADRIGKAVCRTLLSA